MKTKSHTPALILGLSLFAGLATLGYQLGHSALKMKAMERTVTVKGLSEQEFPADIAIWPIQFTLASNDLNELYQKMQAGAERTTEFLRSHGFAESEFSVAAPAVFDRYAQQYGDGQGQFRYTGSQTVTVYSSQVDAVRESRNQLGELGKAGLVISDGDYRAETEYLFTRLNQIKPAMIEEATKNARLVAEKFAADSNSKLGKIKQAQQGQFSIVNRDKTTPHIKKVRVVSTVEYYLSD